MASLEELLAIQSEVDQPQQGGGASMDELLSIQQELDQPSFDLESFNPGGEIGAGDGAVKGSRLAGAADVAGSLVSGAIAEPVAGVIGGLESAGRGIVNFFGGNGGDALGEGVDTIDSVRNFLTADIDSDQGRAQAKILGEAIAPAVEGFKKIESALGNAVFDATGSPELATIAHSLPTAALELLGVKGLRAAKSPIRGEKLSSNVAKAIQQSAPDIETIKQLKTSAYKEIDSLGVKVNAKTYDKFADTLLKKVTKEGLDPSLTPKSAAAMNRIINDKGSPKSLGELETLRKIAKGAANDIDKTDARIGSIIIDSIDTGTDQLSAQIGGKFKEARGLAQRGFKSQLITDMIENASHTASGLENGLRIEARKILKSPKKRRGFTADETTGLKRIEQGTSATNAAKFLGKFGISEGQATSMLGAAIGMGGGGALGATFGGATAAGVGAVLVPALGQVAKKTAQRLTLNNAKYADDLARSGKNAKKIVRTYLKHTPTAKRNVSDLTDLLAQEGVSVDAIKSLPNSVTKTTRLVEDARFFAKEIKRRATQAGSAAIITTPAIKESR